MLPERKGNRVYFSPQTMYYCENLPDIGLNKYVYPAQF